MKKVIVIGAGGHSTSLIESIVSCGFEIDYIVDKNKAGNKILGYKIKKNIEEHSGSVSFIIGIGDNHKRQLIFDTLKKSYSKSGFPIIIHDSASISKFAEIDEGTVVLQNAVIGSKTKVGKFCIINSNSSVDHECRISDFSSLAPGAILGGKVEIGVRSAVGIGAIVQHNIKINDDVVIGGNSYVNYNIHKNVVAFGTPAKVIRKRIRGDEYL